MRVRVCVRGFCPWLYVRPRARVPEQPVCARSPPSPLSPAGSRPCARARPWALRGRGCGNAGPYTARQAGRDPGRQQRVGRGAGRAAGTRPRPGGGCGPREQPGDSCRARACPRGVLPVLAEERTPFGVGTDPPSGGEPAGRAVGAPGRGAPPRALAATVTAVLRGGRTDPTAAGRTPRRRNEPRCGGKRLSGS